MKNIFSMLMVCFMLSFFTLSAFAATPTTVETVPAVIGGYTTAGSDASFANKQMAIIVFSGSLPSVSEASIKYFDQTTANPAGEYSFSYVVDAPTNTTGNYTVLVGGETLTTPLPAGIISTPIPPSLLISGSVAVYDGCKNAQNITIIVYKYNAVTDANENPLVTSMLTNVTSSFIITKAPISPINTVEATYQISGLSANTKYRIEIKKDFWVKYVANITVGTANVTLPKKTLYGGDFSNDNSITIVDFGILKQNLGKTAENDWNFYAPGTGAYRADANEDGSVNILDFAVLKKSLGKNIASYDQLQPNP